MKTHLYTFLACIILAAASAVAAAADARPNVIIVLTDDQGFGELGAKGNPPVRTPHIDRFAAQGRRWRTRLTRTMRISPAISQTTRQSPERMRQSCLLPASLRLPGGRGFFASA
jgi:hypothetical protein